MAIDPGTMQQMLAQHLMQPPQQPAPVGGGQAGPQMQGQTSPMNAGAQLMQKILAMKAMQNQQQGMQQKQAQAMLPGTQAQIAADPTMQAMQQSPQLPVPQFPQQ
jgi:hypothetical protein